MLTQKGDDLLIAVHVKAGAFQDEVIGEEQGELKIRLRAKREKGKANEALIELLADFLDIAKSHIEILSGFTSPHKRLILRNINLSVLFEKLARKKSKTSSLIKQAVSKSVE